MCKVIVRTISVGWLLLRRESVVLVAVHEALCLGTFITKTIIIIDNTHIPTPTSLRVLFSALVGSTRWGFGVV